MEETGINAAYLVQLGAGDTRKKAGGDEDRRNGF